ncbi:DNA alkylation repair protein [Paenibacillus sp. N1-5-1-14]|uniref:DNA alkylation repair protein n=1 Tax=Paenibacillus radicibacter TaxID=2972488 RepID=UPI002158E9E4|nr:DNA alkylation repair protein [Paenibacillus radicibacter]MCR8644722.1 DNA alkylation repair protein [Paenibacillus radicibacter]
MDLQTALSNLESMGTEQNRKTFTRHGAGKNLYGVSFANLNKLKKSIKVNQPLAEELWATGNVDACILAAMIADPKLITSEQLDHWIRDTQYYCLIDEFAKHVVSRTLFAMSKVEKWTTSEDEWIGRAGWQTLACLALSKQQIEDEVFEKFLMIIRDSIHQRKNRTREAMNTALIAIGVRNEHLETVAKEAARTIGQVHIDHGDTSCKTPDAIAYIDKTNARKKK